MFSVASDKVCKQQAPHKSQLLVYAVNLFCCYNVHNSKQILEFHCVHLPNFMLRAVLIYYIHIFVVF